jgi:DNA-binding NarL/FixJ family response regulator
MSIRIILVDDHALVREGIARLLDGQQDMRVIASFGAGRDAIRYAEREEAEVAVLDVAMPDLNGIEVARGLQDASPETRIVMLSMHADIEYVHRALLAGAQGYVLKGCPGRVLLEAVRVVHAGRRFICEEVGPQALEQYVRERGISDPLGRLSAREREVLQHTVEGRTIAETAERLQLSPKSVETYRSRLMAKLEIEDIPALVKFAIRHGITTVN